MEFLTTEVIDKLLSLPYVLALMVLCLIFLKIILGLIDVIKEKNRD